MLEERRDAAAVAQLHQQAQPPLPPLRLPVPEYIYVRPLLPTVRVAALWPPRRHRRSHFWYARFEQGLRDGQDSDVP